MPQQGGTVRFLSLIPSQLVTLVISPLCFASHAFMLTYSNVASAAVK